MCNYNQKIQRLTADLKNSLAVKVIVIFNCKYVSVTFVRIWRSQSSWLQLLLFQLPIDA